jgi:L-fuculose-phosphate aldolase
VDAVIIAHPPSAMVFAVTDVPLDSRTIPESYILLRDVPRLPYGTNLVDVERAAGTLSLRHPVVVLENDSLMFAGTTLLNAFDRLEVAEYSAKAIIAARELGEIVAIDEPQVAELVEAFHLDR